MYNPKDAGFVKGEDEKKYLSQKTSNMDILKL